MRRLALLFAVLCVLSLPARAADPVPGDTCPTDGWVTSTGGSESGGAGSIMLCQGGTWQAIISFNSSGGVTEIGNQTCATSEVLKFDGAKWACAADGGPAETDPQVGALTGSKWCAANAGGTAIDCTLDAPAGDNLGNHVATQNIQLNGHWLSGDGDNEGVRVDGDGDVGIGAPSIIGGKLGVQADSAVSAADVIGIRTFGAQSVANTGTYYALASGPTYTASSGTLASLIGGFFAPKNAAAGTVTALTGVHAAPKNDGSGPANSVYGVLSAPEKSGTGTVTSMYGFYTKCKNSNATGSVSNCYGLFVDTPDATGGIANSYGVYQSDSASMNYFAGNVGVGNTSPGYKLDVAGTAHVAGAMTTDSTLNVAGTATFGADLRFTGVISDISDIRLKAGIAPLRDSLNRISALNGISFYMKGDSRKRTEYGFAAQDVQKVFPDLVLAADDPQRTLSVNYLGLIAPMVEAIKDLKAQNEELRARLEAVERQRAKEP